MHNATISNLTWKKNKVGICHAGKSTLWTNTSLDSRLKLSENFQDHWSIRILGEIHMDQSLVHTFSWGNSYGPMVLKVLWKFPPTLALVHGWLFPVMDTDIAINSEKIKVRKGHWMSVIWNFDTEYDRAKVPPYNGNDPCPPLVV